MAKKRRNKTVNPIMDPADEYAVRMMFECREFGTRFRGNLGLRLLNGAGICEPDPDPCTIVLAYMDTLNQLEEIAAVRKKAG